MKKDYNDVKSQEFQTPNKIDTINTTFENFNKRYMLKEETTTRRSQESKANINDDLIKVRYV